MPGRQLPVDLPHRPDGDGTPALFFAAPVDRLAGSAPAPASSARQREEDANSIWRGEPN